MKTLADMHLVSGAPVLLRASLNVPVHHNRVKNTYRLEQAVPTIQALSRAGARTIIIGHMGGSNTASLLPVFEYWKREMFPDMQFSSECVGAEIRKISKTLPSGGLLLLENLRRKKGEQENDRLFAKDLASCADYFVQDAFDACHRPHASIIGVPAFLPSYGGLQLEAEIKGLSRALSPSAPSLAIIGGAKIITKAPLIRKLFDRYDTVFVGGAIVHDIFLSLGYQIGRSLSTGNVSAIADIAHHPRLLVPCDVLVEDSSGAWRITRPDLLTKDDSILDAGPETISMLSDLSLRSKMILWNGPLGNYERGCKTATEDLARAVAQSPGESVVGGGDTVASIEALHLHQHFTFVSTGGGAMLDFLTAGTLPGIEALG